MKAADEGTMDNAVLEDGAFGGQQGEYHFSKPSRSMAHNSYSCGSGARDADLLTGQRPSIRYCW